MWSLMLLGRDVKWFYPGREDAGEVELLLPMTQREWRLPSCGGSTAAAPHRGWKVMGSPKSTCLALWGFLCP